MIQSNETAAVRRQRILLRFQRSRTTLLRTCLICLSSIPAVAAAQMDGRQEAERIQLLEEVEWLTAGLSQDPKQKAETKQDAKKQDENLTLDEIFSEHNPNSIDDLRAMQEHMRQLADRLKPATVSLRIGQSQGSGVIISRDGYILTAAHVIGKPGQDVTVIFSDGNEVKAKSLGLNHSIDSGLVKITDEGSWPYLDMGTSKTLKRGQWVMSVGHPGGFDKLRGPVVRVGRITYNTQSVVRSDCTLVGGDSGGPLFDMDGNVVGIHSRIGGRIEDNMHVPVDIYGAQWDDLEKGKELGRRRSQPRSPASSVEPGFRTTYRLVIDELKPNGVKAGLKIGDVIKKFNDEPIKLRTELRVGMSQIKKGQEFELTIERGGKEMKIKVKAE